MEELKEDYPSKYLDLNAKKERKFQRIACPSCASDIPAVDLNINDKIAKCGSCNAVFSFEENILSMLQEKPKQELIRPEGIEIFYFKDEMDVTIDQPILWWENILIMTAPVFAFLFTLVFFKGKIALAVPAVLWGLTVLISALLLFRKKQKIFIQLDEDELTIKWRPKKLIKDRRYASRDIDQLYVTKGMENFMLKMIIDTDQGQKHVSLVSGITSISKVKFLEQEFEKHLGIKNRKVPEELS